MIDHIEITRVGDKFTVSCLFAGHPEAIVWPCFFDECDLMQHRDIKLLKDILDANIKRLAPNKEEFMTIKLKRTNT